MVTVTQGLGSSLSRRGITAVVNPSGKRRGSRSESGSLSTAGLSQPQHWSASGLSSVLPPLHEVVQPPHVWAEEPCTQHRAGERERGLDHRYYTYQYLWLDSAALRQTRQLAIKGRRNKRPWSREHCLHVSS